MNAWRWKFYSVIVIGILCAYIMAPTFLKPEKTPFWLSKILPSAKVKLGLDLQGGMYLVMGVNGDKVVIENVDRYADGIIKEMKEKGVEISSSKRVGDGTKISVKYNNPADVDKIKTHVHKMYPLVYITSNDAQKELIYDISEQHASDIKKRAVEQTIEAIRNRIDEFGVNDPAINAQGNSRVLIQLPGVKDPDRAKSIIGRTAKLEFKIVVKDLQTDPKFIMELLEKAKTAGIVFEKGKGTYADYVDKINKFLEKDLPENTVLLFERETSADTNEKTDVMKPYVLEKKSMVTGDHLANAYVTYDNNQYGKPVVSFEMNPVGSGLFGELTGKNIGKKLAIILDNNVYSAPVIQSKITSHGQITMGSGRAMNDVQKEAEDIALVLRAGALPAELTLEEERVVGPTMGADSIKKGVNGMLIGAVLVVLFMLVYYRQSGLIANIVLLLNVMMIFAVLILFGATLTLPGLAGIALTIGMAVDANILIYERARDELRAGNGFKTSIELGYSKALWTILDANITTAIAGVVLLQYGTGPVKGFAVTLLVGIAATIFTAVWVSKWIFEYLMARPNFKKTGI